MIQWKLERRSINELQRYDKNPRTLSQRQAMQLSDSIDRFGLVDKPVVNADNTVIGGHQRLDVLLQKGGTEVDCWIADRQLDEKEVEELCIRLNRNHGEFDWDILANNFDVSDLLTWGFEEEDLGLEKPQKAKKEPKPVVSFEFDSKDDMLEWLPTCEQIHQKTGCKMKVRG